MSSSSEESSKEPSSSFEVSVSGSPSRVVTLTGSEMTWVVSSLDSRAESLARDFLRQSNLESPLSKKLWNDYDQVENLIDKILLQLLAMEIPAWIRDYGQRRLPHLTPPTTREEKSNPST